MQKKVSPKIGKFLNMQLDYDKKNDNTKKSYVYYQPKYFIYLNKEKIM